MLGLSITSLGLGLGRGGRIPFPFAPGSQPTAMASPPTITAGVNDAATTIPVASTEHLWGTAGKFNLMGGEWFVTGASYPNTLSATARTTSVSVGTVYNTNWRGGGLTIAEFNFNGRYLEPKIVQSSTYWRLVIDGEYADLPFYNSGGVYRTLIDFGSAADRVIRFEAVTGQQTDLKFMGASCESTATITATDPPAARLLFLGDSFAGTTGLVPPNASNGLVYPLAKQLGVSDYWDSFIGGTGWLQGGAGLYNVDERWTADVTDAAPTVAIIALGLNDIGDGNDAAIETLIGTKLDELHTAHPGCLVHMFGPWDVNAPSAPQAGFAGMQTAIQNAAAGRGNVWFHSLEGVAFTKSDATHPDAAGYIVLWKAMYNKIAAVHGLPVVV